MVNLRYSREPNVDYLYDVERRDGTSWIWAARINVFDGVAVIRGRLTPEELDATRKKRRCERCGGTKPLDQSCGCFDNNCQ